ncbi:beta-ketoacyl-[acyl-carrier-protein] synthase II [Betaproteobacteria bacterium]|nr:beta-ketoacyl-[acyl-carrier-protein] synthase II [Betaproteobacteria bacterium]GHU22152.1 beta-ketoacyl-[acyl-carrier-protein] synthase II [Betaproteobacteria bacterium]
MEPLLLSRYTATSALGRGLTPQREALEQGISGLTPNDFDDAALDTRIGRVAGLENIALPPALADCDCRNNRLALLGLEQDGFLAAAQAAVARYGASRVAVILGTSTSGIFDTELAYRRRDPHSGALPADFNYRGSHSIFGVAGFVRRAIGAGGPAWVVSTACSSSAKVFAAAVRLIHSGLADAAVVGGVDSLCLTTLYGFNSLELVGPAPCRPYDAERSGISIGEAAAFVLLERPREVAGVDEVSILLTGYGESSDAHHMSAPHPQGLGAQLAMNEALGRAGRTAREIDYINLHGTGTPANDAAEGRAVAACFGVESPPAANSTKGATGHTLGAAGALEAVFCALALEHGFIPASPGTRTVDATIPLRYVIKARRADLRHVLSNSLGFGGSNCSLVFSRREARS